LFTSHQSFICDNVVFFIIIVPFISHAGSAFYYFLNDLLNPDCGWVAKGGDSNVYINVYICVVPAQPRPISEDGREAADGGRGEMQDTEDGGGGRRPDGTARCDDGGGAGEGGRQEVETAATGPGEESHNHYAATRAIIHNTMN